LPTWSSRNKERGGATRPFTMRENIEIVQGVTYSRTVTVRDSAGTKINVTGATATWKLAKEADATADLSLSVGSGITLTTPAQGLITIAVTAAQADALAAGTYVHECKLTVGGVTYRPFWGDTIVTEDID